MVISEPNIKSLSQNFRSYSVPAKKDPVVKISSELLNVLKIKITELKATLREKEDRTEKMIALLEQITWITKPDTESLSLVIGVIQDAKRYVDHEVEFISFLKPLIANGLVKKEYDLYINLIDDLQETVQDVESAFFTLAKDQGFNASLKELEAL